MQKQPTQQELIDGLKRSATIIQNLTQELAGYHEPIGVVGMGCRFPGDVNTPAAFWQLLRDGICTVTEAPWHRWQQAHPHDDGAGRPTYYGHYLRDVGCFDAHFFGISPREALWMDPQQQILLEVSIEALEHANLPVDALLDSRTGIYIGVMNQDHLSLSPSTDLDVYSGTGKELSFTAGRLSYLLGVHGPSLTIGTACSSSLATTHLACQALRAGECDLALSGGVSLILSPESHEGLALMQATAPDGLCKTFDAAADGYGRGEGCGVLVLKRLSAARRDGDTIWALIRGSAVNHDGRSGGLTVPSGPAQEELLRQALAAARVEASAISYVEAHGTGTILGDPIELRGISNVFGKNRQTPLLVGSAKTNIGHLESAAGVAGLMKVILALQHKQIPPHLHLRQPNPHIDWQDSPIQVPLMLSDWQAEKSRLAGISSFGLSGTNAHAILEEAPATAEKPATKWRPWHLLTLSAKTPAALSALVQRYREQIAAESLREGTAPSRKREGDLADLCYTSHVGRSHYVHRLAIVASSPEDAQAKLAAYVAQEERAGVIRHEANQLSPKVAFLFTGQGAQYAGMGRELYASQPLVRATLDRCDQLLRPSLGQSLLTVLYPEQDSESPIDQTTFTQPALFALEVALATLWQAWGVQPHLLIGHSVGEVAAACVAGVFSLEDGLTLIAARARLMGALPPGGTMLAVMATEARVRTAIAHSPSAVSIAAINGPESIVISGNGAALLSIAEQLSAEGIKTRKLTVSHAFHSPLMEPMLAAFRTVAATITYHKPKLRLISNLTGKLAGDEITTPDYWVRHVRETVLFAAGVQALHEQGTNIFLEIGPKPVLIGMIGEGEIGRQEDRETGRQGDREIGRQEDRETGRQGDRETGRQGDRKTGRQEDRKTGRGGDSLSPCLPVSLPSLRQGQSDWRQMLESLGALYGQGVKIDWVAFDKDSQCRKVVLPTYPFQRQYYWREATQLARPSVSLQPSASLRPLIDKKMRLPRHKQTVFEKVFSTDTLPFLADHQVYGKVVVPGACYLALALSGADLLFAGGACILQDVIFPQALLLPAGAERTVQLVTEAPAAGDENGESSFQIISFNEADDDVEPLLHTTGRVVRTLGMAPTLHLADLQTRCQIAVSPATIYDPQAAAPIALGPTFRWMAALWRGEGEALAQMQQPDALASVAGYPLFPGLIDACLQLVSVAARQGEPADAEPVARLPFAIANVTFYAAVTSQEWWCHVQPNRQAGWDIRLLDGTGRVILAIEAVEVRAAPSAAMANAPIWQDWLYEVAWQPQAMPSSIASTSVAPTSPASPRRWLIMADQRGIGAALADRLRTYGDHPLLVQPSVAYQACTDDTWAIQPDQRSDYQRLWGSIAEQAGDLAAVIHLWSLDGRASDESVPATQTELEAAIHRSCASALSMLQTLDTTTPPPLWLITQGAQAITAEDRLSGVAQAPLWGLGQVATLEQPASTCIRLDLDEHYSIDQAADALFQSLLASADPTGETQIALRGQQRYVARLQRSTQRAARPLPSPGGVSGDGTVLISGGLGGLGLALARWFVTQGVKHLVLVGRRAPTATAQVELDTLRQMRATLLVMQADIADEAQVAAVLAAIDVAHPLRGIVHAAGVLDDALLPQQDWARFTDVLRPKVAGAWHLHSLTQHLPLDFFVLFSSVASLLGNYGQANYAAANAFLDALAQQRRAQGRPALSINWGPWSEIGMAAELANPQRQAMAQQGISFISPAQGVEIFAHLLTQDAAGVGVVPLQWTKYLTRDGLTPDGDRSAYLSNFHLPVAPASSTRETGGRILQQLAATVADERPAMLVHYLTSKVAHILRLGAVEQVNPDLGLIQMGLDSLLAVELRNAVNKELRIQLSITVFIDSSLRQLATLILPQLTQLPQTGPDGSTVTTVVAPQNSVLDSQQLQWDQVLEDDHSAYQGEEMIEEFI